MKAAGDDEIWTLCVEREAVIITKDRDFADRYMSGQRPAPRIVWIRILTRLEEASAPIIEVR